MSIDERQGLMVLARGGGKADGVTLAALIATLVAVPLAGSLFRHDVGCPCPNCSPSVIRDRMSLAPGAWSDLVRTWAPAGPTPHRMGDFHYHLSVSPEDADRAQMALATAGRHAERQALVDSLYTDLTARNPALASIPTRDPRARHWVVLGALSGLPPIEIDDFVRGR